MKSFAIPIRALLFLSLILNFSCSDKPENTSVLLTMKNYTGEGVAILPDIENIPALEKILNGNFSVKRDGKVLPYQISTDPVTGKQSLLILPGTISEESSGIVIDPSDTTTVSFTKMTQAELWVKESGTWEDQKFISDASFVRIDSLRVPDECTDHSFYVKYEGPGWESNKVGYRFYLDWRNAVDVFGKKVNTMVLNDVGQDGYDSYHEPSDWGQDIMKVGDGLGIGTIAYWDGEKARRIDNTDSVICKIPEDGILRSQIQTDYYGWGIDSTKHTVSSFLSIDADSRLTRERLVFDLAPENICTGFNKNPDIELIKIETVDNPWACLASWGKQSISGDNMGVAIFYKKATAINITEDAINHVVVMKPEENMLEWYYLATWEQDSDGIKDIETFKKLLEEQLSVIQNPPVLE